MGFSISMCSYVYIYNIFCTYYWHFSSDFSLFSPTSMKFKLNELTIYIHNILIEISRKIIQCSEAYEKHTHVYSDADAEWCCMWLCNRHFQWACKNVYNVWMWMRFCCNISIVLCGVSVLILNHKHRYRHNFLLFDRRSKMFQS